MGSGASSGKQETEFYWDYRSPPSRCAHMTLVALGEKFTPKPIDLFKGEHKKPEYLAINPAGKVPALKVGNFRLNESKAIACYLCNRSNTAAAKKLYPRGAQQRAEVDRLLLIAGDVMDLIQKQIAMFTVLFGGGQPKPENIDEAAKGLKIVADYLGNNNWLTGNTMTLADIFCISPFLLYDMATTEDMQKDFYSREGGSTVKAWMKRYKDLPYYDEVNAKGIQDIGDAYRSKLN